MKHDCSFNHLVKYDLDQLHSRNLAMILSSLYQPRPAIKPTIQGLQSGPLLVCNY